MGALRLLPASVLGLILCASAAFASTDRDALLIDDIRAQQSEIRAGVESRSGPYKSLSDAQRNELLSRQGRMLRTLEGKQSIEELSEQQRVDVFNTLEWIEGVVNNSEDERMVCERRPILGSHRKERVCKTEAQWAREREAARRALEARGACPDCKTN
ncbi:hypothetical protein [Lysobacter sp.]|uniref:hypothetical protein n=1 Tax=Lysobacter sp. TaxID=72226 RepID=UPI002D519C37|nr:hypothetical protein [Lysobacter sp.]HZX78937.1 hypothetical protein [Lysobacter sp.]